MRTTIELPDALFRRMKATAALEGRSLRAFITQSVSHELERVSSGADSRRRTELPLVPSKAPGSLHITADEVADALAEEDLNVVT